MRYRNRQRLLLDPNPGPWLLNDSFLSDRAVGAVNNTLAEPGPGMRQVVDSNSKLSLAAGYLSFATGGVGNGNPALYYTAFPRVPGRVLASTITVTASTLTIGWDAGAAGQISDCIRFLTSGTVLGLRYNLTTLSVGVFVGGTEYQIALVARATGMAFFIKGGLFVNWTLLWISNVGSSSLTPAATVESTTVVGTSAYMRVRNVLWLLIPLASDGYGGVVGTTDGKGHAEGVAGSIGAGGGGLAWTQLIGTWANASGVRNASVLVGSEAIALVDTGKADAMATAAVTIAGGHVDVIVRYSDASNYVYAKHDGTNASLFKVVATVHTSLVSAAAAYVAGAELRVICDGQKFRLYYNDVWIGTEQTVADAALQAGTQQGLRSTNTGNTFDNFVVYARGNASTDHNGLDIF